MIAWLENASLMRQLDMGTECLRLEGLCMMLDTIGLPHRLALTQVESAVICGQRRRGQTHGKRLGHRRPWLQVEYTP